MPVVSAAGQILTPLVVIPGVEAKHLKQTYDKYETSSDFLTKHNYLHMRPIDGIDTSIFSWAQGFLKETPHLRSGGKMILLIMHGYACHVSF